MPLPPGESLVWVAVCWLSVWRLTALLVYDSGPFDLLTHVRVALSKAGLHRVITCFHCAAVWVSFVVVGIIYKLQWKSFILAIGVAGAASITERFLGGGPPPEDTDHGSHV